jgi:hypothetical protein
VRDTARPKHAPVDPLAVAPVGQEVLGALARPSLPFLGTRMASSTAQSCVPSLRCPGVTITDRGRPLPSQARCTLVEKPPLPRPKASSGGCSTPFLCPPGSGCGGHPRRANVPGRPWSPRLPTTPPHPLRHSWSAPQRVVSPRSHRAANAQIGRSRSARVRSGRKLRVGFVQAICYRAVHAGIVTTANRHEGPEALCAAVRSHNLQRG